VNALVKWAGWLAWLGFLASAAIHAAFLLGRGGLALGWETHLLMGAIFLAAPAILVQAQWTQQAREKEGEDSRQVNWSREMWRACPGWLKALWFAMLPYSLFRFFWHTMDFGEGGGELANLEDGSYLMLAYLTVLIVNTGTKRLSDRQDVRVCTNGHPLDPDSKYCRKCGAGLARPSGSS
jgi:hypothetical protein